MAPQVQWHLSGDYFENCNCSVVCSCLVSKAAPLTSRPTEGICDVALIFHIEEGRYGDVALDGLITGALRDPSPIWQRLLKRMQHRMVAITSAVPHRWSIRLRRRGDWLARSWIRIQRTRLAVA